MDWGWRDKGSRSRSIEKGSASDKSDSEVAGRKLLEGFVVVGWWSGACVKEVGKDDDGGGGGGGESVG